MLERECAEANVTTLLGTRVLSLTRDGAFRLETTAGIFALKLRRHSHRRPLHPQDGRYRLRLPDRRTVRPPHHRNPPSPRPSRLQPRRSRPLVRPGRPKRRSHRPAIRPTIAPTIGRRNPRPAFRDPVFREKMLITHRGLSGPAILQISSYWQPGEPIQLDLAPGFNVMEPMLPSRPPVHPQPAHKSSPPSAHCPAATLTPSTTSSAPFSPPAWPNAGSSSTHPPIGPTPASPNSKPPSTNGPSLPPEPKATPKPK